MFLDLNVMFLVLNVMFLGFVLFWGLQEHKNKYMTALQEQNDNITCGHPKDYKSKMLTILPEIRSVSSQSDGMMVEIHSNLQKMQEFEIEREKVVKESEKVKFRGARGPNAYNWGRYEGPSNKMWCDCKPEHLGVGQCKTCRCISRRPPYETMYNMWFQVMADGSTQQIQVNDNKLKYIEKMLQHYPPPQKEGYMGDDGFISKSVNPYVKWMFFGLYFDVFWVCFDVSWV